VHSFTYRFVQSLDPLCPSWALLAQQTLKAGETHEPRREWRSQGEMPQQLIEGGNKWQPQRRLPMTLSHRRRRPTNKKHGPNEIPMLEEALHPSHIRKLSILRAIK